jgi:hypothetical protein
MSDREITTGTVSKLRKTRRFLRDDDLVFIQGSKRFSFRKGYSKNLRYAKTFKASSRELHEPLLYD